MQSFKFLKKYTNIEIKYYLNKTFTQTVRCKSKYVFGTTRLFKKFIALKSDRPCLHLLICGGYLRHSFWYNTRVNCIKSFEMNFSWQHTNSFAKHCFRCLYLIKSKLILYSLKWSELLLNFCWWFTIKVSIGYFRIV